MAEGRHTHAILPELIADPIEKAKLEALNGLRQFETAIGIIEEGLSRGYEYKLRISAILQLHRVALEQISEYAGAFRPGPVEIRGSAHEPQGAYLVPVQVEELCDYVNANWAKTPIYLAAYVLWRLNWIHPFPDGNGRTARMLSYVVLCIRLGYRLPGKNTIPDQIADNRDPYYDALEKCDASCKQGRIDVTPMETLLESLLAAQLVSVLDDATQ